MNIIRKRWLQRIAALEAEKTKDAGKPTPEIDFTALTDKEKEAVKPKSKKKKDK